MSTKKVAFAAIFIAGGIIGTVPLFVRDQGSFGGAAPRAVAGTIATGGGSGVSVGETLGSYGAGTLTRGDLSSEEAFKLYEAEKKVHEAVEDLLLQRYVQNFFEEYQADNNLESIEQAQQKYMEDNASVSDADVKSFLDQNASNPGLQRIPEDQREEQVRRYLEGQTRSGVIRALAGEARRGGRIVAAMSAPIEPRAEVGADGNAVLGDPSAPVTIVEFADYQCPFCARMVPTLKEVVKRYDGKVNWVYRDFPLQEIHPEALPAAVAANCAGEQGKYYEMHHRLFDEIKNLGSDTYDKLAKELSLDMDIFGTCLKNPEMSAEVIRDQQTGQQLGVNGTPAYFINGRRLSGGVDISELTRIIDEELAAIN